ncbi:uncharacterized protein FOMMEDRAFT_25364 [Fomitiporia mediterranea MF3/22]|uniref:uncharacterized protein n=1 Tax=Fomitiporia mediterranea (strain MF3/22) TaxID=694068 RepID=UPI000440826E|nr:uncharacterized protein FOMMEDRAFT_25364 [Fomitiporia mediterranea MF3/22]EJD08217.1 hypothetical protein FOMMEDRAFT_25364 [Fomitiporia mediterranea MF3/22]
MSTTTSGTLHVDLSGTFGPVFWAFVVSTVCKELKDFAYYDSLFGVSVVQGYFYYLNNNDPLRLRVFVAVMLALDFTTTALSSQSMHDYLIINFGNPFALLFMTTPYITEYAVTTVVTLASQLFYASRIHIVAKDSISHSITILIGALAVAAFGLEVHKMMILAGLNTGLSATCDIVATAAMCIFLASQKSVYKQTRTIVSYLLFISINRGALVAIAQLGFMISYLAAPSKTYWMPFHLSVSKLHVNTLLAMLNARQSLRERSEVTQVRFSKDCTTFNTQIGRGLRESASAKGSLRLSGMAFELGQLSKAERHDTSPTTLASPSSVSTYVNSPMPTYTNSPMPTFSHPHRDEDDLSGSEV